MSDSMNDDDAKLLEPPPPTDDDAKLLEPPPTDDELRAAEALRAALEKADAREARPEPSGDAVLVEVALRARAALGHAAPLDATVRAAAIDAAVRSARVRPSGTRARVGPWLAAAAVVLVGASGAALAVRFVGRPAHTATLTLPADAYARPTDALFGAGLAPEQRASARLDAIVSSRTRGYFAVVAAELAAESEGAAK